jgi:tetratricopeptide (TPR) repeat protein
MRADERSATHLKIATLLVEPPFAQEAAQHPESLAYHFEEGGALDRAIEFLTRAALAASARSAHAEAIHHYERALRMLVTLPETAQRDHAERTLWIALGSAYMTTQGYAAEPVERSFERALELCNRYSEAPRLFSALNGLWAYHLVRGDAEQTPALVKRMQDLAARSKSDRHLLFARHAAGSTAFYAGRLGEALPALAEATELLEKASAERGTGPAWHRHAGTAPLYLGWCLHLVGKPEQALGWKTRGLELATQLADIDAHVEAMTYGVALHHDRREPDAALELSNRIVPLAEAVGLDFWLGVAKAARGWAICHAGDVDAGLAEIDEGMAMFYRSGAMVPLVYRACYVAEAQLLAGRVQQGIAAIDAAFEASRGRFDRYYDAEALRLRGELLARGGGARAAEAELRRALELARVQGARLFELRAAASLVRLHGAGSPASDAREALEAVYRSFDEGLDLADLVEARALLAGAG